VADKLIKDIKSMHIYIRTSSNSPIYKSYTDTGYTVFTAIVDGGLPDSVTLSGALKRARQNPSEATKQNQRDNF
jgi:hypothetical protein